MTDINTDDISTIDVLKIAFCLRPYMVLELQRFVVVLTTWKKENRINRWLPITTSVGVKYVANKFDMIESRAMDNKNILHRPLL